jgi:hypothetical protein|tara:strand:+ start:2625 stop:3014 length:390 start_codon:yes stop_codon:yes gene_type:complete
MSITTTNIVDDTNKVITSVSGIGGETEQLLLDASKLSKADSAPRLSIENIHYQIQGTGKINLYWDAEVDEEILELDGYGNYGLISSEKNKEISSTTSSPNGDVLLTSDSNVKKYNLVLEFKKETGFTAS